MVFKYFSDILVIGKGEDEARVNPSIIKYLRSKKINVEILSTVRIHIYRHSVSVKLTLITPLIVLKLIFVEISICLMEM